MKKGLFILFIAALTVSLLLGCGGGETPATTATPTATPPPPAPPLLELVPQKANMLGSIDLSQIIEDEDIAGLYEAMPIEPGDPQTLDEALDMVLEESGLDLRDFREGLMFGDMSDTDPYGDVEYIGYIVKGSFSENELIASIESEMDEEFTTISYQGYEIYTDPFEETGLAFLGSDALVIGSMDAVKDVIAVRTGDGKAISGKVLSAYNGLGSALVKMAMEVPPEVIEEALQEFAGELPGELPIDLPLDELADLDTVGASLAKSGQSISLVCRMCFTSSDSAEFVGTLISFALILAGPGLDIPEEAQALLENLDASVSGSCLDISLEMTMSEIQDMIESAIEEESPW